MGMDHNPLVNKNGIEKYYSLTAPVVRSIHVLGCFRLNRVHVAYGESLFLSISKSILADELKNSKSFMIKII